MGEAAGNGTAAAKLAGYRGSAKTLQVQASRLLSKAIVQSAIAERAQNDPAIATRAQRQQWWTSVMQDAREGMKERLKASELLGKSQADFVEKHEVTLHVPSAVTFIIRLQQGAECQP